VRRDSPLLDGVTKDPRRPVPRKHSRAGPRAPVVEGVEQVEGVDVAGEVPVGEGVSTVSLGRWRYSYPSTVRRTLMRKSGPQPVSTRTPIGGTV
jgi:hypothetical protein